MTGGILISLPALFVGEGLSIVLFAGVGVIGGLLRDLAPEPEDIWRFSPWFDQNVYRLFRGKKYDLRKTAFSLGCGLTILLAEGLRITAAELVPNHSIFSLYKGLSGQHWLVIVALFALLCSLSLYR